MSELFEALPSLEELKYALTLTSTWWQIGILISGILLALLIGQRLQHRLQPAIQPGSATGIRRTAMRTGVLVAIPLILWVWLVAASALLRHAKGMPTDILHLAILLVGALTMIRMGVFVLRHSFSPGSKLKAWEGVMTVTIWGIVALHILGWLPFVEQVLDDYSVTIGKVRISIYTVTSFVLSIALLVLVALWLSSAMQSLISRSQALDDNLKIAITKLAKFLLLALAVLTAMITAGIDLTALAVFGGALGVGLGLGLQRIVSNFISGIILSFEGSVQPGNVISVGQSFGIVKELHARHIVVRSRDGMDFLIPNETLLTSEIVNWSYTDRDVRFRLPVQISYNDDPELALAILERAALETERVLHDPAPAARLMGFGESGINLELRLWINDPENGVNNVHSDAYRRIWRDFRAAGITIPFPQRDIHVKPLPAPDTFPAPGTSDNRAVSARDRKPAAEEDPAD
jgi:small-conductance mechanosensitive channel